MDWNTPIRYLPGVGPIIAKRLEKLNITTVADLLWHIPFRYNDYSLISEIVKLQEGEQVTIIGKISQIKNYYTKSRLQIQKAIIMDPTGTITVTWFNQSFLINILKPEIKVALTGKVSRFGSHLQLESPDYEIIKNESKLLHSGRLVPIYNETDRISSKWIRGKIALLLETPFVNSDYLPDDIIQSHKLLPIDQALRQVHFPQDQHFAEEGKIRLAYDELFILELRALMRRQAWQSTTCVIPFKIDFKKITAWEASLPFNLTLAQKRVSRQILSDLTKSHPMNRLLQGDVGSGKTVVAAMAIYATYLNHLQSLFMAPTEILAEQHFQTLTKILSPLGLKIGIMTGSQKSLRTKNEILNTKYDLLVGTHALIQKGVSLDRVGLVVIDEQHRFGVKQRALLRQKGTNPHVLTMTATPIPRTVMLTVYGDLDLSVIDQMPQGRLPIKTWVVPPYKRASAYDWIRQQIIRYHTQAFIVCPLIEPSESIQTARAAKEEFNRLKTEIFPDLKLNLLHGRLPAKEKNRILTEFRLQKFDILICTPVVEVGIDIPRATIMLIETAERFGLAQLHQLRGRVGRADKASYCLLFTSTLEKTNISRLKLMQKAITGAQLAEYDLQIRGPGDIYGIRQHGINELKVASLADLSLIEQTKNQAQILLKRDNQLTDYPALKERVLSGTIHEVTPD